MNLAENGAENYDWNSEGVYQLEVTDRVQGGPGGVANRQAAELANRTRNLHGRVQNVEANKAPLANPAFTGTPTAPTAAVGTNNTQIANTAFVQALVAALVNSSPAALDTLKELATALGNDANFATTMTNALAGKLGVNAKAADSSLFNGQHPSEFLRYLGCINGELLDTVTETGIYKVARTAEETILLSINLGGSVGTIQQEYFWTGECRYRNKTDNNIWRDWRELWHTGNLNPSQMAPLVSPAFTGTPTAPTAAAGTNNTQIANTAFVQAALAALVASSPDALNTLNELAAALGNDPNFATTIINALAGKLNSSVYTATDVLTKLKTVIIIGARNLVKDSKRTATGVGQISAYILSEPMVVGQQYTASMFGITGTGATFRIWVDGPNVPVCELNSSTPGRASNTFVYEGTFGLPTQVYVYSEGSETPSTIFWIKIERGNIATDWSPSPEEEGSSDLPGSEIDWSDKPVRTKTLTANTTLTFSNLIVNKTITLRITGAYTLILPASVTTISGEYDGSKVNLIQLLCINSAVPEVWCVISQPKA